MVSNLRKNGGIRRPGDGACQHKLQRLLPHHGRALPERRYDSVHAVPDVRSVQGFSDAEVPDPAWRRSGAISLGAVPWLGAGDEETPADGTTAEQHLF